MSTKSQWSLPYSALFIFQLNNLKMTPTDEHIINSLNHDLMCTNISCECDMREQVISYYYELQKLSSQIQDLISAICHQRTHSPDRSNNS